MKKKNLFLSFMSLVMMFMLVVPVQAASAVKTEEKYFPTLFVHGYMGDGTTFDALFEKLNKDYKQKIDAIYVIDGVDWNGSLVKEQYLTKNTKEPIIKVVFANNVSGVLAQSYGVKAAIQKAITHYNVSKVNLVGHSMGGLAIADYMANEEVAVKAKVIKENENVNKKINKFVSVDSPFLGSTVSNTKILSELKRYFKGSSDQAVGELDRKTRRDYVYKFNKGNFPKNVKVLSVNAVNDPLVEKDSAFGLSVYMEGVKMETTPSYKQINFMDASKMDNYFFGRHSAILHQKNFYTQLVDFLWK